VTKTNIWKLQAIQLENFCSYQDKQTITFVQDSSHFILAKNLDENNKADSNGGGKAQPLSAQILTPYGWTTMGEITVGQRICNTDGSWSTVLGVFPQGELDVYEITFSDGSKTRCCGEHLWAVRKSVYLNKTYVLQTKDLIGDLKYDVGGYWKWQIPITKPTKFFPQVLPLDPYLLGMLIGNGGMTGNSCGFSTQDQELVDAVKELLPDSVIVTKVPGDNVDYYLTCGPDNKGGSNPLTRILRNLGLLGKNTKGKFVPETYKFSSPEQRLAFLQGLMDTDGTCSKYRTIEWVTASLQLAKDVQFMVQSLGGRCRINKPKIVKGVSYQRCHINMPPDMEPFRLQRKAKTVCSTYQRPPCRVIRSIEKAGKEPCQCIMVDSKDQCYLTDECIVTHNTSLLNAIVWCLYGKSAHGLQGSDLISHGAKRMKVVAFFNGLEVTREYSKHQQLSWCYEGDTPVTGDVKVLQAKFEADVLGMNYNVFLNCCTMFGNSKTGRFLSATPGERSAILGDLVDDYLFQQAGEAMKRDMGWYQQQITSIVSVRQHYQATIHQKEAHLAQLQQRYEVEREQEQTRKTQIEMKMAEMDNRARLLLNQIATPPGNPKELEAVLYQANQNLQRLSREVTELEVELRKNQQGLYEGNNCPACKRYVDKETVEHLRLIYEEETHLYQAKAQEMQEAQQVQVAAQEAYTRYANWVALERAAQAELQTIKERLLEYQDQLQVNMLKHLDDSKHQLTKELHELYEKLEGGNQNLDTYHYNYNLLSVLYPGFKTEIKNILFDQIRGELEGHVYTYSLQLGGDMFRITFPAKTQTNRERFEILIENGGYLQDLSAYSNGEAWRASFAVLLGLRLVMMRKHNARLNMLLIDDPIGNLDKTGVFEFFQAIQQIQGNEKNLILVTLPVEDVLPSGGKIINVVKENNRSMVR